MASSLWGDPVGYAIAAKNCVAAAITSFAC